MTKTKVPQLRFSGFSGEWKEDKIGRIMDVGSVYRIHQSDWKKEGIPFIRARDIVSYLKNRKFSSDRLYISEEKYEKLSKKTGIVKKGDVLVTGVGTIGKPFLINTNKPLYFKDGNIIWLKNNNKISPNFLFYNFLSPSVQKEIISFSGVGTVGTYTIDSAKKTKIILPINDEQQKIGSFFAKQDKLIELQTQKVDQLKKLKRGYLQKMFPQEGETVPRLRFSGFSGEWTQKLLLDSGLVYGGLTGKTKEDFGHGNSKFVPYMSVNRNFVSNDNDVELVNVLESEKQHAVKKNDVLFTISSETPEEVGLSSTWLGNEETYLNSFSFGYRFNFPTDGYFTSALFRSSDVRNKIYPLAQGISRYNLSKHSFLDLKLRFPKFDEQKKIGVFFEKLDQIIGEQTDKIEILKKQKKAYLQKMFI